LDRITGAAFLAVSQILEGERDPNFMIPVHLGRIFPAFGVFRSLALFVRTAASNTRCNVLSENTLEQLCMDRSSGSLFRRYQYCCGENRNRKIKKWEDSEFFILLTRFADNCEELGAPCFTPTSHFEWETYKEYERWNYYDDGFNNSSPAPGFTKEILTIPGLSQEILVMTVMGIVYLLIVFIQEYGLIRGITSLLFKTTKRTFTAKSTDSDVNLERERVQQAVDKSKLS